MVRLRFLSLVLFFFFTVLSFSSSQKPDFVSRGLGCWILTAGSLLSARHIHHCATHRVRVVSRDR